MDASVGKSREKEPRANRGLERFDDLSAVNASLKGDLAEAARIIRMFDGADDTWEKVSNPVDALYGKKTEGEVLYSKEEKAKRIASMSPEKKRELAAEVSRLIRMHQGLIDAQMTENEELAGIDKRDGMYTNAAMDDKVRTQLDKLHAAYRQLTGTYLGNVSRATEQFVREKLPNWYSVTKRKVYDSIKHALQSALIVGGLSAAGIAGGYALGGGLYGLGGGLTWGNFLKGAGGGLGTLGGHAAKIGGLAGPYLAYPFQQAWKMVWGGKTPPLK